MTQAVKEGECSVGFHDVLQTPKRLSCYDERDPTMKCEAIRPSDKPSSKHECCLGYTPQLRPRSYAVLELRKESKARFSYTPVFNMILM